MMLITSKRNSVTLLGLKKATFRKSRILNTCRTVKFCVDVKEGGRAGVLRSFGPLYSAA